MEGEGCRNGESDASGNDIAVVGDTQEASPSALEEVRSRSISARISYEASIYQNHAQDEEEDGTIPPGDPAYVDFTSEAEDYPIDLSPDRSQLAFTQFPESQRFRTPATAGKKRDHAGNIIDTPAVSRNPFANNNDPNLDISVGLSQAFAQTQANSSPFIDRSPAIMRSDLPTPGLQVQRRVQLPTSSPTTLLSTVKRATTEPAERYIPIDTSQELRRGRFTNASQIDTQGTVDDWFDSPQSALAKQRRAKTNEVHTRETLKAISSPLSPRKSVLIARNARSVSETPAAVRTLSTNSIPSSPPAALQSPASSGVLDHPSQDNRNENHIDLQRHSDNDGYRVPQTMKRPSATLVPNTMKRCELDLRHEPHQSQTSPTVRPMNHDKSQAVHILNSQRSRPATQENLYQPPHASGTDSVDFVPASPTAEPANTHGSSRVLRDESAQFVISELQADVFTHNDIPDTQSQIHREPPLSTVPETSSACVRDTANGDGAAIIPLSTNPEFSSQPVVPPPGRKRRRMMEEISQDDFTPQASQITSFDPKEALTLDDDLETAKLLASTQDEDPIVSRRRAKIVRRHASELTSSSDKEPVAIDAVNGVCPRPSESASKAVLQPGYESNSEMALPMDVQAIPKLPNPRRNGWDIGHSPKQKHTPRQRIFSRGDAASKADKALIERESQKSRDLRRAAATNLPVIEEDGPTPDAVAQPSSATSLNSATSVSAPNMVFAYYMDRTRAYYPARCLDRSEDGKRYTIEWPGYAPDIIAGHMVCSLDLRVGDEVKVSRDDFPKLSFKIRAFGSGATASDHTMSDVWGHTTVLLEPKQSKGSLPKGFEVDSEVSVSDIYIDLNSWKRISKRPFRYAKPPCHSMPGASTPPVRCMTPATPPSRVRNVKKDTLPEPKQVHGLFSNMLFALSIDDPSNRQALKELVIKNGGVVLEHSFQEIFTADLHLKPCFQDIGFTALLADKHSRKPKYLEALALGLPCLSSRWVETSIKQDGIADWQDYLLAAGESSLLDGAIRSRVLPDVDASASKLMDAFANRPRFFSDASGLFVIGKGKAAEKRASHLFFARVMGGDPVEEVVDLAAARSRLQDSDHSGTIWLFVDSDKYVPEHAREMIAQLEDEQSTGVTKRKKTRRSLEADGENSPASWECRVADSEFVVQSLILGRLLHSA